MYVWLLTSGVPVAVIIPAAVVKDKSTPSVPKSGGMAGLEPGVQFPNPLFSCAHRETAVL